MRRGIAAAMAGRLQGSALVGSRLRVHAICCTRVSLYHSPLDVSSAFHVRGKLHSAQLSRWREEQTQPAQKAPAGSSGGGRAARPAGIPPAAPSTPAEGGQTAGPRSLPPTALPPCGRFHVRPVVASQPAPCPARTPRSRSIGCPTSARTCGGSRSRPPSCWSADRGVDRASRFAPGVTFSRQARKPMV